MNLYEPLLSKDNENKSSLKLVADKLKDSIVKDYIKSELHNRRIIYSVMSGTELYEKYHNKLPVFFVEDIFKEKYVNLEQNNNPDGE